MFASIDDIPRDRWGRPLINPPNGGDPIPYTRVSTLAKALDDKEGLTQWKCRMTAVGMAKRTDLIALAASSDPNNATDQKTLRSVVDQALEAASASAAANIGTSLHRLLEHVDQGTVPDNVPDQLWPDLAAYEQTMKGIEVVGSELFIVCDELQAAGTFDRLLAAPGLGTAVADIKTGQSEPKFPTSVTMQVAIYSRGWLYTHENGRIARLADVGVNQDTGLLIHLPAGKGKCDLYTLDLNHGWALAETAVAVRHAYKNTPLHPYTPAPIGA